MRWDDFATDPAFQESLLLRMRSENGILREAAANQLATLGVSAATPDILDALTQLLDDDEWPVRREAAETIGAMGRKAVVHKGLLESLARQFALGDSYITETTVKSLARLPWMLASGNDQATVRDWLLALDMDSTTPKELRPYLDTALIAYRLTQQRWTAVRLPQGKTTYAWKRVALSEVVQQATEAITQAFAGVQDQLRKASVPPQQANWLGGAQEPVRSATLATWRDYTDYLQCHDEHGHPIGSAVHFKIDQVPCIDAEGTFTLKLMTTEDCPEASVLQCTLLLDGIRLLIEGDIETDHDEQSYRVAIKAPGLPYHEEAIIPPNMVRFSLIRRETFPRD